MNFEKCKIMGRAYLARCVDGGRHIVTKRGKTFKLAPLFDGEAHPIYTDQPTAQWRHARAMPSELPREIRAHSFEPTGKQLRAAYNKWIAASRQRKPDFSPPAFRAWLNTERKRAVVLSLFDASDPAIFKLADNFGLTDSNGGRVISATPYSNVADLLLRVRFVAIYDNGTCSYLENCEPAKFVATVAPALVAVDAEKIAAATAAAVQRKLAPAIRAAGAKSAVEVHRAAQHEIKKAKKITTPPDKRKTYFRDATCRVLVHNGRDIPLTKKEANVVLQYAQWRSNGIDTAPFRDACDKVAVANRKPAQVFRRNRKGRPLDIFPLIFNATDDKNVFSLAIWPLTIQNNAVQK